MSEPNERPPILDRATRFRRPLHAWAAALERDPEEVAAKEGVRRSDAAADDRSGRASASDGSPSTGEFLPTEPRTSQELGLKQYLLDELILKCILRAGTTSGRDIGIETGVPFLLLQPRLDELRGRQMIAYVGASIASDFVYTLTETGIQWAHEFLESCAYVGSAPVPFSQYVRAIEAQSALTAVTRRDQLAKVFEGISVTPELFDTLGPAVNSSGLFLYGAAGNGKTLLAERISARFGETIWIPRTLLIDGEIVQLFDIAVHKEVPPDGEMTYDRRWVRILRPTAVVGGELRLEHLEMRHDLDTHISDAPLQMKCNGGTLLVDDFGRQRMSPADLLNRWIIPLEKHYDFLTLSSGKKVRVPFDQLLIFSTNLDPNDLVDEAFLRRIPYKVEVTDPSREEFHRLFGMMAGRLGFDYSVDAVDYLIDSLMVPIGRPLRRCQPRDLLLQIRNWCRFNDRNLEMTRETMKHAAATYFAMIH